MEMRKSSGWWPVEMNAFVSVRKWPTCGARRWEQEVLEILLDHHHNGWIYLGKLKATDEFGAGGKDLAEGGFFTFIIDELN